MIKAAVAVGLEATFCRDCEHDFLAMIGCNNLVCDDATAVVVTMVVGVHQTTEMTTLGPLPSHTNRRRGCDIEYKDFVKRRVDRCNWAPWKNTARTT